MDENHFSTKYNVGDDKSHMLFARGAHICQPRGTK